MSSHFINGISLISAPHNMGADTWFVQLSSLLTDIWPKNECSVMAELICIKMVRGTFCQLVNIANRFLRIFSNLETSIRFKFPGGAGYPYLPTRLNLDFIFKCQPRSGSWCKLRNHIWHHISVSNTFYHNQFYEIQQAENSITLNWPLKICNVILGQNVIR